MIDWPRQPPIPRPESGPLPVGPAAPGGRGEPSGIGKSADEGDGAKSPKSISTSLGLPSADTGTSLRPCRGTDGMEDGGRANGVK